MKIKDIKNLDVLLPAEMDTLREIYLSWQKARDELRWEDADKMRAQFYWWDTEYHKDGLWHSFFEYSLNRQKRAFMRMRKYKVDIIPWTLTDLDLASV